MSEGLVKVKPPPVEGVCVQRVGGSITINLTLIGNHVVSTVAEPQDNMAVCVRVHVDVKENCLCVLFQFKMYQSHAHPSSSCLSLSMICAREMWLVLRLEAS